MVPPPSAVMAPSMATPNQSILRRPAASAAVMPSAMSATMASANRMVSVGGMIQLATRFEWSTLSPPLIPAKAGIQFFGLRLGPRFRGDERL